MRIILITIISMTYTYAFELQTGDILLQPLHCWTCSLIEAQENTEYSHVGLFLEIDKKAYVIEAFGLVHLISLDEFLAKTEKDKMVEVKRFNNINFESKELIEKSTQFLGHEYDSQFLWDNHDSYGREKIYCSELVYKVFEDFYNDLPLKKMRFDINRDHWIRFFGGNPPDGKWGNSPADFEKYEQIETIGFL